MPALQFSLATLSGLINGNQADSGGKGGDATGKKSGTDQFSSLLDVVGNIGDSGNQTGLNNKKDEVKDPAAVEINAAQPFRDPLDKTVQKVVNSKSADKNSDNDAKPVLRTKNDEQDNATATDKAPAKQATQAVDNNKPAKADDKIVADTATASDEITDELKEKIAAHADNLSQLLNIITQLLAGAGAGGQVLAVSVNSQVKIDVVSTSEFTVGNAAQQNGGLPEIFADLKNNLAQLQQFLQGANADDAAQNANGNLLLSDEQNAALSAINDALQNDLNALKKLFPQGLGADDKKLVSALTPIVSEEQGDSDEHKLFAAAGDVKKLLEDDIALIKEALQKFRGDRTGDHQQTDVVSKLPVKPLITTTQNDNLQLTADNKKLDAAVAYVPTIHQAVAAASEQPMVLQSNLQNNNSPLPVASAVQAAASSDSNSNSNFSGNSGQNGNSGQQFSVAGVQQSSAARANASTAASQFAGMLNRAEHTPVTEQVVFHVKTAVGSGNSKITIQLNPEELGKLDITLDVDAKGKTGVTITADNKQALDLLQKDSSGLQKALSDAGLKTDAGSLSFNLRGGEKEGQGQNQYQASQYQKSLPEELLPEEVNMASLAAVTRSYTINVPDGLDIKI